MARFASKYLPIQDCEPVAISRADPSTGIIANNPGKTVLALKRNAETITADYPNTESALILNKFSLIE